MVVTSVNGHLMELEFEDRFRKWHSCDPAHLYQAPVRKFVPEDKLDIKRTLEEEARKCQWLVLWLDCDREGENIAFEVLEVCTQANRHLDVWRARFSALIDIDARQEIDLRIGASFTRFQTMLLRDAFIIDIAADDRHLVLSYGPCQFPTLGFVVERYWEVQSHEPEEFWTINCSHKLDEGTATFNWMRGHLFDYTCAVIIYEMCVQEPTETVTKVRQQEKRKYPPHPLNTIELEKRASRYFHMSSEHTMKGIVSEQLGHPIWGSYAQLLLDPEAGLWRNPSNGGHDDKAHPPIHPTKFSAGESQWSQDHHRLYELVVRHFLACISQPAVGAETTVEIDIAGESFSSSGRVIIAKNYLDVYRFESWGVSMIPTYVFGQQCRNVVWLPGSISEAAVTTISCNHCIPGCVDSCDEILRQLTEICGTGSRICSSVPAARGRGSNASSTNAQRSGGRPCIHCSQRGHSSNDCPSLVMRSRNSESHRTNMRSGTLVN